MPNPQGKVKPDKAKKERPLHEPPGQQDKQARRQFYKRHGVSDERIDQWELTPDRPATEVANRFILAAKRFPKAEG